MILRSAENTDVAAIRSLSRELAKAGESYVFPESVTDEDLDAYWRPRDGLCTVADDQGLVVGCSLLRPNHMGRGSHVANASYMVAAQARGQGIGRALAERSLEDARARGFRGMQFNLVVSTNPAVKLWIRMGFSVIGTIPQAFDHKELGLVDALIMHRFL